METRERKEDRRTKYTRQAIKDTFLALLEKKNFSFFGLDRKAHV